MPIDPYPGITKAIVSVKVQSRLQQVLTGRHMGEKSSVFVEVEIVVSNTDKETLMENSRFVEGALYKDLTVHNVSS